MAPKRSRPSSSSQTPAAPTESQINSWLVTSNAKKRWEIMRNARIFNGSFVKFEEFRAYRLKELAHCSGLEDLMSYTKNCHPINETVVKLFYANLNEGPPPDRSGEGYFWTNICGLPVFFTFSRIAQILGTWDSGTKLNAIEVDIAQRTDTLHQMLEDDASTRDIKTSSLRPRARLFHKAMMKTVLPRSGSYEVVKPENLCALYAIYSDIPVNWVDQIVHEMVSKSQDAKIRTLYYGEYIMRLLINAGTPMPGSSSINVGEIVHKNISLMHIEPTPPPIMSFENWQRLQQGRAPVREPTPPPQTYPSATSGFNQDEIQLVETNQPIHESLRTLSKNQQILDARMRRVDKKMDKVKGFFKTLWESLSCAQSTATSTALGKRPTPTFTWSTSDENQASSSSHGPGEGRGRVETTTATSAGRHAGSAEHSHSSDWRISESDPEE